MTADRFKSRVKQSRHSLTAKGVGYDMVRSKYLKGPDGYGAVISELREKLIAKNGGKDPGVNTVAMHKYPGAHRGKSAKDLMGKFGSRGLNTSDSNRARARKK